MNLTTVVSNSLNEKYYTFTHRSGLKVFIYPKPDFSKSYAIFATKYGSVDNVFKTQGDEGITSVPAGIAHFLEHKLFESQDGSAFEKYAKTGASANAFTSFDKTAYLFSASENFEESLKILIHLVQNPYFTKESVEKEQGIIGQEIEMYNDLGDWKVLFNCLEALYHVNPVKIDIAGTKDSIAMITPELLYKCYNSFYNPSQMALCVCGNFKAEDIAEFIDKNVADTKPLEVERIREIEPNSIVSKNITMQLSVAAPLFTIGIKDNVVDLIGAEFINRRVQTEILLELLLGESSSLYSELYSDGLINENFGIEYFASDSFAASLISGESTKPQEVYDRIFAHVEKTKKEGIKESDFIRIKKSLFGRSLRRLNNSEHITNDLVSCCFSGVSLFEISDKYKNVTFNEVTNRLHNHFCEEFAAISIVNPR